MITSEINHLFNGKSSKPFESRLMIFDLHHTGHHAGYIKHLVQYWCKHKSPSSLDVLVSNKFIKQHTDVTELAANHKNINFIPIKLSEEESLVDSESLGDSFSGRIRRAFQESKILHRYTKKLKTTHCLLMYLDSILLRLSLGESLPCTYSCIYFRPIFHYSNFENYKPIGREPIWHFRDRLCLRLLMRSKGLKAIMCLDKFAVEHLNEIDSCKRSTFIQDPVQIYEHSWQDIKALKDCLGIQEGRKIFLLFGVLTSRKGTHELLAALSLLSVESAKQMCILLVGPASLEEKKYIDNYVEALQNELPIQVIRHFDFVKDSDVQSYFQLSDVILAPYQRHIGMSAVLVRAATAGKPVISSEFGLMGEITRKSSLGLAIDSSKPIEISKTLQIFLNHSDLKIFDKDKMKLFAEQNKADDFAANVFNILTSST